MDNNATKIVDDLFVRYPDLISCKFDIISAIDALISCFSTGHKLLICGNGGSAADSMHIVGEMMKAFCQPRKISIEKKAAFQAKFGKDDADYFYENLEQGLPCISLVDEAALNTAYQNDRCGDLVFANQVLALGKPGDVLLGISTSGNSQNVLQAFKVANIQGVKTALLGGRDGGLIKKLSDIAIIVPENETYKIQERHLPIYHAICRAVEATLFCAKHPLSD